MSDSEGYGDGHEAYANNIDGAGIHANSIFAKPAPPDEDISGDGWDDGVKNSSPSFPQQPVIRPEGTMFLLSDRMKCFENFPVNPSSTPRKNTDPKYWCWQDSSRLNKTGALEYLHSRKVRASSSREETHGGNTRRKTIRRRRSHHHSHHSDNNSNNSNNRRRSNKVEELDEVMVTPRQLCFPPIPNPHASSMDNTLITDTMSSPLASTAHTYGTAPFGSTALRFPYNRGTQDYSTPRTRQNNIQLDDLISPDNGPYSDQSYYKNRLEQLRQDTLMVGNTGKVPLDQHLNIVSDNMKAYSESLKAAFEVAVKQTVDCTRDDIRQGRVVNSTPRKEMALSEIRRMKEAYSRHRKILASFQQQKKERQECEIELQEHRDICNTTKQTLKNRARTLELEKQRLQLRLIPVEDISVEIQNKAVELRRLEETLKREQLMARAGDLHSNAQGEASDMGGDEGLAGMNAELDQLEDEAKRAEWRQKEAERKEEERRKKIEGENQNRLETRKQREQKILQLLADHCNTIEEELNQIKERSADISNTIESSEGEQHALERKIAHEHSQMPFIRETIEEKKQKINHLTSELKRKRNERKFFIQNQMQAIESVLTEMCHSVDNVWKGCVYCVEQIDNIGLDLMCTLCFCEMKDPQTLWPCGHSFCHACVESNHSNAYEKLINCPECLLLGSDNLAPDAVFPFRNPNCVNAYAEQGIHEYRDNPMLNTVISYLRGAKSDFSVQEVLAGNVHFKPLIEGPLAEILSDDQRASVDRCSPSPENVETNTLVDEA